MKVSCYAILYSNHFRRIFRNHGEEVCLKQPSDVPLFISDYYLAIIELFCSWSYFGNQLKFSFQFVVLNNYSKKEKSFVLLHEIK